ncbi:MAG: thiamine phosphate synthase [Planifilum fimeticola]
MKEALRYSLYLVMGSQDCRGRDPVRVLDLAIDGGITLYQFREKNSGLTLRETVSLGERLRHLCRERNIPFIVNDRADLALLLDADGLHVGQDDLPVREARRLIGPHRLLGVSAETVEEAEQALRDGADYLGVGPIYATATKPDAGKPIGTRAIAEMRKRLSSPVPIVGIGGIDVPGVAEVIQAGADGVAVVSAIAGKPDPRQAAKDLLQAVERAIDSAVGRESR